MIINEFQYLFLCEGGLCFFSQHLQLIEWTKKNPNLEVRVKEVGQNTVTRGAGGKGLLPRRVHEQHNGLGASKLCELGLKIYFKSLEFYFLDKTGGWVRTITFTLPGSEVFFSGGSEC